MVDIAALLLADGRFPSGGHAHSGGVEAAVADGRIAGLADLPAFLAGRLATVGLVDACLAAATHRRGPAPPLDGLIAEADARCASPALRGVSRALGRQLLRSALVMWPESSALTDAVAAAAPSSIAFGVVGLVAGLDTAKTATVTAYQAVVGPATAAVRLLGFDPRAAFAIVFDLASALVAVVTTAVAMADTPLDELPGRSSTVMELAAERHSRAEARLFAS
jgi:urease accessory protein